MTTSTSSIPGVDEDIQVRRWWDSRALGLGRREHHAASLELLETHVGPLIVPTLVITEVTYLLGSRLGANAESAGSESFIDVTNGALWSAQLFDVDQGPVDFDPESDRWPLVVGLGSTPAYETMRRFVATIQQPDLASRLTDALGGCGAFQRFHTELSRHEREYTRWHRFWDDARLGRARAWLAERGYQSNPQL